MSCRPASEPVLGLTAQEARLSNGRYVVTFSATGGGVSEFGGLNILANIAGEQHVDSEIEEISEEQLRRTFDTNVFGTFFLTQAAMPHLKEGGSIINTASINSDSPELLKKAEERRLELGSSD